MMKRGFESRPWSPARWHWLSGRHGFCPPRRPPPSRRRGRDVLRRRRRAPHRQRRRRHDQRGRFSARAGRDHVVRSVERAGNAVMQMLQFMRSRSRANFCFPVSYTEVQRSPVARYTSEQCRTGRVALGGRPRRPRPERIAGDTIALMLEALPRRSSRRRWKAAVPRAFSATSDGALASSSSSWPVTGVSSPAASRPSRRNSAW